MIENGKASLTREARQQWPNLRDRRTGAVHVPPWPVGGRIPDDFETQIEVGSDEAGHVELCHITTLRSRSDHDYSRGVPRETSSAALEICCPDVSAEVEHFTSLGWRIVDVFPADEPQRVTIDGHGLRIIVVRGSFLRSRIVVSGAQRPTSVSPNGTEIVFGLPELAQPRLVSSPVITRATDSNAWHIGRAGMHYRDLVPDRQGGAVIASHIRIPTGGPVPDYPHFHEVVFQLIFCHRGWVRLAYESQGEPFVLHAGECVIQPPTIRHQVLESSDDLHVVEVGYPAEHLTIADHDFDFSAHPTDNGRTWNGQYFLRFTADDIRWTASAGGADEADTGIGRATGNRAGVRLVRTTETASWTMDPIPDRRFAMVFVLEGRTAATIGGRTTSLLDADSAVIPVGDGASFSGTPTATLLVVTIETD